MSITNKQKFFASLALIYGALCWGVIWFPYRLLNSSGLGGVHASLMSYLFALLMGACLFYRRWRLIGKLPLYSYGLSVVAGWTNLAYVLAVIDGEVMRVMLLFYLSPLWTLLLARVWLREVWRLPQLIAIILSLIGASLMLTDGQWMLPIPQSTPDWLALSAGIGFSITNVMTRFCTELSLAAKSMLVWLGVFVMSILLIGWQSTGISPLWSTTLMLDAYRLSLLMLIALLIVTATLLVQYGVTQMPAIQASVLFMTELIVAAIAAYFLAHETMTVIEMVGGGCIILAGLLSVLSQEPTTADSA